MLGSDLATASVSSRSYSASIGMSVSAAGCSIEFCSFMISHRPALPTAAECSTTEARHRECCGSAARCRIGDVADVRRRGERQLCRSSAMVVITGTSRALAISAGTAALAYDDQTQVPATVELSRG